MSNNTPKKALPKFLKDGIRFECQGSGKCCTSRGEYGYVYLTLLDRKRMAAYFGTTLAEFNRNYCFKHNGHFALKDQEGHPEGDCRFLKDKKCSIYEARPEHCRTWPFWPEVMSPKKWKVEVADFCPGIGKGKVVSPEAILRILATQRDSS